MIMTLSQFPIRTTSVATHFLHTMIVMSIEVAIQQMFQHLAHLIYGAVRILVMNMTHLSGQWLLETTFVKIEF